MSKVVRLRKWVPALLKQKQGAADPAPCHFLVALYDELDCGDNRLLLEQRAHLPIEIQENSMPAFLAFLRRLFLSSGHLAPRGRLSMPSVADLIANDCFLSM